MFGRDIVAANESVMRVLIYFDRKTSEPMNEIRFKFSGTPLDKTA